MLAQSTDGVEDKSFNERSARLPYIGGLPKSHAACKDALRGWEESVNVAAGEALAGNSLLERGNYLIEAIPSMHHSGVWR